LKSIRDKLTEKKDLIIVLKEEIQTKQKALKNSLEENEEIKINLLNHYQKLLKEGKDTR